MSHKHALSVLIVDDHPLFRLGLKQVLNEEYRNLVFGEANDGDEAAVRLTLRPWDLVILAMAASNKDGLRTLAEIRQSHPVLPVLVLSTHAERQSVVRAQQLGASGHLRKNVGRADLLRAFKRVLAGKEYFEDLPASSTSAREAPHAGLSAREYKVMLAFVAGKRPNEIAADLSLSVKTISTYKRRFLDKLGLHSTADLVHYAIHNNLS